MLSGTAGAPGARRLPGAIELLILRTSGSVKCSEALTLVRDGLVRDNEGFVKDEFVRDNECFGKTGGFCSRESEEIADCGTVWEFISD